MIRRGGKVGRNAPCPCGCGKKAKRCAHPAPPAPPAEAPAPACRDGVPGCVVEHASGDNTHAVPSPARAPGAPRGFGILAALALGTLGNLWDEVEGE